MNESNSVVDENIKNTLKDLHSGNQNIQEYIKLYPALEEREGYILVRIFVKVN